MHGKDFEDALASLNTASTTAKTIASYYIIFASYFSKYIKVGLLAGDVLLGIQELSWNAAGIHLVR